MEHCCSRQICSLCKAKQTNKKKNPFIDLSYDNSFSHCKIKTLGQSLPLSLATSHNVELIPSTGDTAEVYCQQDGRPY